MINEAKIRKLTDYVLLNACSINSSGLYNGKAGIALALFEVARHLQDEYINEQAFELLKEALVSKTEDINFENGLSGIGCILLHLIKNDFIEADFNELFGGQLEKILDSLDKQKGYNDVLMNSIRNSYFLALYQSVYKENNRIAKTIKLIFKANEHYLSTLFFNFKDIGYVNNRIAVLKRFEIYLQMVSECRYADYSRAVLNDYAELYRSGRILSSYKIAIYLKKIDTMGKYKDVIDNNRLYSYYNNIHTLTLRESIDLSFLSGDVKYLQDIFSVEDEDGLQKVILQNIPRPTLIAGYEQGISRLLIYLTSNKPVFF